MVRALAAALFALLFVVCPASQNSSLVGAALLATRSAGAAKHLAEVRYIDRGLAVRPPSGTFERGRVNMPLFNGYLLRTLRAQRASIQFVDKTVIHFDQLTDAELRSPTQTQVNQGVVAEYLTPGTTHEIHTAAAVASAIGTTFLVNTSGSTSTFVVLHGVVQVSNPAGTVLVRSNQETSVVTGEAPQRPRAIDAKTAFGWNDTIPTPDLGENIGLASNGASIEGFSSERDDGSGQWHVDAINDGLLATGWETASGQVTHQWVKVGFYGSAAGASNLLRVQAVVIDPAATGGDSNAADLRNFEIRVSATGTRDADFTTVFHGTCRQSNSLQTFTLPVPVLARHLQFVTLDNYGSPDHLAVAELEIVGTNLSFAYPEGIARDTNGNLYVADTGNDRIEKLSSNGKLLASWGTKGSAPGQFTWPTDVAVDRLGRVYVLDAGTNNRVQVLSSQGQPLRSWGSFGTGPGEFRDPSGIALDHAGNVYVIEHYGDRIQKFTSSGRLLHSWGTYGSKPGQFIAPQGIALDRQGNMYVADSDNNRIQKLSPDGLPLATWGTKGTGRGQFNAPSRVTVDARGFMYVTDTGNNRIIELSPNGKVITNWGKIGLGTDGYYVPFALLLGPHESLYVVEEGNNRIKRISARTGRVLDQFGVFGTVPQILGRVVGVAVDAAGTIYVTDDSNSRLQVRASDGSVLAAFGRRGLVTGPVSGTQTLGQFALPERVAVDSLGYIYVADTLNDRIQILSAQGPIAAWGGPGITNPGFKEPNGLAIDRQDNVYVADSGNYRIVKLSPQGKVLASFGTKGSAPGQFNWPTAVAVDDVGNMYVVDTLNYRIQKLSPTGQPLAQIGGHGNYDPGQFDLPAGIAVDRTGNLYVADEGNDRIQKLSSDLKSLAVWGAPGSGDFRGPEDVAVDSKGNVYVADTFNLRIVKLTPEGKLLAYLG